MIRQARIREVLQQEVKPCPFCGKEPIINNLSDEELGKVRIECDHCHIGMTGIYSPVLAEAEGFTAYEAAKATAVFSWNRRTKCE